MSKKNDTPRQVLPNMLQPPGEPPKKPGPPTFEERVAALEQRRLQLIHALGEIEGRLAAMRELRAEAEAKLAEEKAAKKTDEKPAPADVEEAGLTES